VFNGNTDTFVECSPDTVEKVTRYRPDIPKNCKLQNTGVRILPYFCQKKVDDRFEGNFCEKKWTLHLHNEQMFG
jgi:hypothetical protein